MAPGTERRSSSTKRIAFDGLVEVGGAAGASFEARGVDVSDSGMHLKTAFLPELGQVLTCRFDAGAGGVILAAGEVVWRQDEGEGGEFGLRFTDLDDESLETLRSMMGPPGPTSTARGGGKDPTRKPSKVRLHIEGLSTPMRAKVRSDASTGVTVGSELGFLRMGKELAVEDAGTGVKRPATIDRVDVAIDPTSKVPELVVALRYLDGIDEVASSRSHGAHRSAQVSEDAYGREAVDDDVTPQTGSAMENPAARVARVARDVLSASARRVGPALSSVARRTATTASLLLKNADRKEVPHRRTTAPPPGGGLHASGRRVVRGEVDPPEDELAFLPPKPNKRVLAIGSLIAVGALAVFVATRKPGEPPKADESASIPARTETETTTAALPQPALATNPVHPSDAFGAAAPAGAPLSGAPVGGAAGRAAPATPTAEVVAGYPEEEEAPRKPKKVQPAPFGAPVAHGNVLRLRMDGPIEELQGARQPTGFTVVIPGRHALHPAAPLAARDARIGTIRVANEQKGAELSVTFRDGVPRYQVRARGDALEIVLAPVTKDERKTPTARADDGSGKARKSKHR